MKTNTAVKPQYRYCRRKKGSERPGKTSADSAPGAGHIDGYANL